MYDVRDMQLLQETLAQYNDLVNRPLLHDLNCLSVVPPLPCTQPIYLLHIKTLPENSHSSAFSFILNALASLSGAMGYFICSSNGKISIYIGIKGEYSAAFSLLQSGLIQTFPGATFEVVLDTPLFLTNLFSPSNCFEMTSTTVIPSPNHPTLPLLTQFSNLMGSSSDYTAFFLAHPLSHSELLNYHDGLCEIYNTLSIFNQVHFNHIHGLAKNSSTTITNSKTTTDGHSMTETDGNSKAHSDSSYTNTTISTGALCPYINNNINLSFLANKGCSHSHTDNFSCAQASSCSTAHCHTDSRLSGENKSDNHGITYSAQNIYVQNALSIMSGTINRAQLLLQSTAFEYGAYFFSPYMETSMRAAYTFMGLAHDASTYLGPTLVNHWSPSHPSYSLLLEALLKFESPKFYTSNSNQAFQNTTFIQSTELLNSIYFPI